MIQVYDRDAAVVVEILSLLVKARRAGTGAERDVAMAELAGWQPAQVREAAALSASRKEFASTMQLESILEATQPGRNLRHCNVSRAALASNKPAPWSRPGLEDSTVEGYVSGSRADNDGVDSQIDSVRLDGGDTDQHRDVTTSRAERQLRRLARRQGVHLVVDEVAKRAGLGGYAIVDWEGGEIMYGGGLPVPSCDRREVEDWLLTPADVRATWWES